MIIGVVNTIGSISSVGAGIIDPDAQIFIDRVIADGGTVEDPAFLNAFILDAKANNYFNDIIVANSPSWGVKGTTTASIVYSLTGAAFDLPQAVAADQPAITSADLNGNTRLVFDGVGDHIGVIAYAKTVPITRIFGGFEQVTWKAGQVFVDGLTVDHGMIQDSFGVTPQVRLRNPTNAATNTDFLVGSSFHMEALFNGASSSLKANNGTASTGDSGANNIDGLTIGTNPTAPAAQASNMKYGFYVELESAIDGAYAAKMTALYNFSKSAYGTA